MKTIGALTVFPVLAATGFLMFIYSGLWNVAAMIPHSGPVRWVLDTMTLSSVRARAGGIVPPPRGRSDKNQGFLLYDRLCVHCHGAPGVCASEVGLGLGPEPPSLATRVGRWRDRELFWIMGHGLRSTGMPSFGATRADEELWSVVAFLRELPSLSPEAYLLLRERSEAGQGDQPSPQAPRPEEERPFEQKEDIQRQAI
ncbi:MAG: cytochrome c [Desulfobacteraceae bacterium]|nr:cytochrome c [Desulfobacteraceae bacterium]